MYHYKAFVREVYDGDTITVDIDLGLDVWKCHEKIRLFGINTPELSGEDRIAGLAARDYLRSRIIDREITLRTVRDKKGKYGRYLGVIILDDVNINDELVEKGHAVEANY